jgi:hypothetical protein
MEPSAGGASSGQTGGNSGDSDEARNGDEQSGVHSSARTGQFSSSELDEQLENAERLIAHAAESGIRISDEHRSAVLAAKSPNGWTAPMAASFLTAMTEIARKTRPVTGESLKACAVSGQARQQTRYFAYWMWGLVPLILVFSIADFYESKLCEQIQTDLHSAQALAVKLNDTLFYESESDQRRVPVKAYSFNQSEVINDLTQFAMLTRAIHTHTRKLDWLKLPHSPDPFPDPAKLELDPELSKLSEQTVEAVRRYQAVRQFAQTVRSDATILYGALLQCLLPMLYAILGTLAFLLRRFDRELSTRTFSESGHHTARFATAAIGGIVVGLFNLDIAPATTVSAAQGASISPLAIAFMVGYAVEMFFSFVETIVAAFTRTRVDSSGATVRERESESTS